MLVNLPNGKTVDIPLDEYLRLGREGYQYLVAQNFGSNIEYPFAASAMFNKGVDDDDEEEDDEDDDAGNDFSIDHEYEE